MAKMQFLTIFLTVTSLLDGVVSVTDKEIEDQFNQMDQLLLQLKEENKILLRENERQNDLIAQLVTKVAELEHHNFGPKDTEKSFQNTTIEERVSILEFQVVVMEDDIAGIEENLTELDEDVTLLEDDVNFLFDEQVIQNERLFSLEQTVFLMDEEVEDLQDTTFALDFRVTALEEDGGGDGNSSVAELEVRVETLEGVAADHETRISATEVDVNDLEEAVSDQETRLTAAEENLNGLNIPLQGLQMTDVELNARVTALEEGGGGNSGNETDTIAFNSILTSYSSISEESAVLFNEVLLNEGDGYNSVTGTFTVPVGGDGYYYFSTYFVVWYNEYAIFDIRINGDTICTAYADREQSEIPDEGHTSCSATTYTAEGDEVQVVYRDGTETTPVVDLSYQNGFTGFRI